MTKAFATFILLQAVFLLSSNLYAQEKNIIINENYKNQSLKEVFDDLESLLLRRGRSDRKGRPIRKGAFGKTFGKSA